MSFELKKRFLETYGVLRIFLGVGQIVGLFSGYFLLEWVARYPLRSLYVIQEEGVALACLVILLKGVFHIVSGIGIARCQLWVRSWILYGWMIMVFITYGFVSHLAHSWVVEGMITHSSQAFTGLRIGVYLFVILFDWVIVNRMVKDVDQGLDMSQEAGLRLEGKKIGLFLIVGMLFFIILLLYGRPIQKGFHQGYYKLKNSSMKSANNDSTVLSYPSLKKEPQQDSFSSELLDGHKIAIVLEKNEKEVNPADVAMEPLKKEIKRDIPHKNVFCFLGGLLIFIGILFQMLRIGIRSENDQIGVDLIFLCCGFFFWIIYGFTIKQNLLAFFSAMISLLCLAGVFLRLKR